MKVFVQKIGPRLYTVRFRQGFQSFTIDYQGSEKECKWMATMVRLAFKKYAQTIKDKP